MCYIQNSISKKLLKQAFSRFLNSIFINSRLTPEATPLALPSPFSYFFSSSSFHLIHQQSRKKFCLSCNFSQELKTNWMNCIQVFFKSLVLMENYWFLLHFRYFPWDELSCFFLQRDFSEFFCKAIRMFFFWELVYRIFFSSKKTHRAVGFGKVRWLSLNMAMTLGPENRRARR